MSTQGEGYCRLVEIVSLTGTLSKHSSHYHIAIADGQGKPPEHTCWQETTKYIQPLKLLSAFCVRSIFYEHSIDKPDVQIAKRRVWDEEAFGPKNLAYLESRIKILVAESLALFELLPQPDCNPYDLDCSERRVTLASIIAMDTPILLLDEPTAGLDPREIVLLTGVLEKLRKADKTVIIISHDMD